MRDTQIKPIIMPKWGLSMSEGRLTQWLKKPGDAIAVGDAIVEVETDKIAGVVEANEAGVLRRVIGAESTVYPVKALLGVVADPVVDDAEIDSYVANYVTPAGEEADEETGGPAYLFLDTNVGRFRYAASGEGEETVVLVHGFGGDLDNWLFNIDALAGKARVYALDLPGHGQSSKTLADPSIEGLARALLAFLEGLSVERAHLVGHSMGGLLSLQAGLLAPQRVKSLTLIGSAGLGDEINAGYVTGFTAAASKRELKPVLEQLFADPGLVSRQMVDDLLKYKRLDDVNVALKQISAAFVDEGRQRRVLRSALQEMDTPVLVIWGEADRVIPASHAAALGDRVKSEVIPGAGHMVQMEKSARVNELILAHIAG
jgi:pyruvate dehydrogenase E2 component (dihydrolipoamide acetyltransferase)